MTLLTPHQLYEKLGRSIGINAIYSMLKEPHFPCLQVNGRYLIIEDKVMPWLEAHKSLRKKRGYRIG